MGGSVCVSSYIVLVKLRSDYRETDNKAILLHSPAVQSFKGFLFKSTVGDFTKLEKPYLNSQKDIKIL